MGDYMNKEQILRLAGEGWTPFLEPDLTVRHMRRMHAGTLCVHSLAHLWLLRPDVPHMYRDAETEIQNIEIMTAKCILDYIDAVAWADRAVHPISNMYAPFSAIWRLAGLEE